MTAPDTVDRDAATIDGWLTIWAEATVACQTDAACEAAEELTYLLRKPVLP